MPEFAVGFRRAEDDVVLASVKAMRITLQLVIRRCHHFDECTHRRIVDQRYIVLAMRVRNAQCHGLCVASPEQRAATGLDHRNG